MLRFVTPFRGPDDAPFTLRHAHAVGYDGATLESEIALDGGVVELRHREAGAVALALQWDAGDLGDLLMQTCLLPARERPYLLSLELARRHIMILLNKLEDWGEFERAPDDDLMRLTQDARERFMDALAVDKPGEDYTEEEDGLAKEALRLALEAGERLTIEHADAELDRRFQVGPRDGEDTRPQLGSVFGCAVDPERYAEPLQKVIANSFDYITIPARWKELEPEEGAYRFSDTDRWIEWAVRKGRKKTLVGPLIEFSADATPDWFYVWENDYETIREMVYEHVKRVVTRYRRVVNSWSVCCGLHVGANITLSLEQAVDLTRLCALVTRKLAPKSTILVEIDRPFGEPANGKHQTVHPQLYAELISQAGIAADMIGLRLQVGDGRGARPTRDLLQLSALLDEYAVFEKPISVTAIGAPSSPPEIPGEVALAGRWREGWSDDLQRRWLSDAVRIALSKPFVACVCWQQLYDTDRHDQMTGGGLITADGKPKPALRQAAEIHRRLHARETLSTMPAPAGAG